MKGSITYVWSFEKSNLMKTIPSPSLAVKRIIIIATVFLASMGFGYSVVSYFVAHQPDLTVLLPVFIGSATILFTLIGSARIIKR